MEIQLSNEADWRSETDADWHFSTLWSTFASTGTSGSFNLPSTLALVNGTTMHMRIRAVDSGDQWGPWDSTSFLLPTLNVVDNGDGTASMTFGPTDTGLENISCRMPSLTRLAKPSPTEAMRFLNRA